jgi:hypothetical protein
MAIVDFLKHFSISLYDESFGLKSAFKSASAFVFGAVLRSLSGRAYTIQYYIITRKL